MNNQIPLAERFWAKVLRAGPNECWLWQGFREKAGYGRISSREIKSKRAHRVSWFLATGDVPEGCVCHSCDNPPCVNPAHLWLGDNVSNTKDRTAKGRHFCTGKTHCKYGHEFTPENTHLHRGARYCLACKKERGAKYNAQRRGALA